MLHNTTSRARMGFLGTQLALCSTARRSSQLMSRDASHCSARRVNIHDLLPTLTWSHSARCHRAKSPRLSISAANSALGPSQRRGAPEGPATFHKCMPLARGWRRKPRISKKCFKYLSPLSRAPLRTPWLRTRELRDGARIAAGWARPGARHGMCMQRPDGGPLATAAAWR